MKKIIFSVVAGLSISLTVPAAEARSNQYGQQTYIVTVMTKKSGTVKVEISARNVSQARELAKKQYPGAKIGAVLPKK